MAPWLAERERIDPTVGCRPAATTAPSSGDESDHRDAEERQRGGGESDGEGHAHTIGERQASIGAMSSAIKVVSCSSLGSSRGAMRIA